MEPHTVWYLPQRKEGEEEEEEEEEEEKHPEARTPPAEGLQGLLRTATWNIRTSTADIGHAKRDWRHRGPKALELLFQQTPLHVLCLQEVTPQQRQAILRALPTMRAEGLGRLPDLEACPVFWDARFLSCLFSRTLCLTQTGPLPLKNNTTQWNGVFEGYQRIFTHLHLKARVKEEEEEEEGMSLHVINTHLPLRAELRAVSLMQLLTYCKRNIPNEANLMIAGDFNTTLTTTELDDGYLRVLQPPKHTFGHKFRFPHTHTLDYALVRGPAFEELQYSDVFGGEHAESDHALFLNQFSVTQKKNKT